MSTRLRTSDRESQREPHSTDRAATRVETFCEGIIEAGWLVALAIVPLCFNVYSARTYEPDKIVALRSVVIVMVGAWLWKTVSGGRAYRPTGAIRGGDPSPLPAAAGPIRRVLRQPLLALAGLLAVLLVVGSLLSVDPRLSWLGSYPRYQGAWTQLAYLVLFALTVAHLRTASQWRRIVFVVILTSLPVSLFALSQAAGLDPLQSGSSLQRAVSTLGNPIFLGAYLSMVVFVTWWEVGRSLRSVVRARTPVRVLRVLTLTAISSLQLVALILTQSRGPVLAVLVGAYVFFLVLALFARALALGADDLPVVLDKSLRWAWVGIIGTGLAVAGFLITLNLPHSPLAPLKRTPYFGRLGSILDSESSSAQVRLLIWRSVTDLLVSDEPLTPPDSHPDRLEPIRTLIGYGPETFPLAINRHIAPELGQHEARSDMPDRSHNETFDSLVMHGALGYAVWLAIYCGAFRLALGTLGLVRSRPQRISFWVNLGLGATLGSVGPFLLLGTWTLSGVGLAAGMITGVVVFVTLEALIGGRSISPDGSRPAEIALMVALLATLISHVVEIHFGITIVSTRLYFWLLTAVLVVLSQNWLGTAPLPAAATSAPPPSPAWRSPTTLTTALLAAVMCAPLIEGLVLNAAGITEMTGVLSSSLWSAAGAGWSGPGTLLWLLLSTVLAAALLLPGLSPGAEGGRLRSQMLWAALLAGVLTVGYAIAQAGYLAGLIRLRLSGADPLRAGLETTQAFALLVWLVVIVVLALGTTLGWRAGDSRRWSRRSTALSIVGGLALALGAGWLIGTPNLDPIRADTLLKQARAYIAADRPEIGLRLLDRACELSPAEPMHFLIRGQAAMRAADAAKTPADRTRFLAAAEATLARARDLAPLDPDHSANLARHYVKRIVSSEGTEKRQQMVARADEQYEAALSLRPKSVLFLTERVPLLMSQGRLDEAEHLLERALRLDDEYARTPFQLAVLYQSRAAKANEAGDVRSFIDYLQRAIEMYQRALRLDPDLERAKREIARLQPVLEQVQRQPRR